MIATHVSEPAGKESVFSRLAAPIPKPLISWRIDGKPVSRDGKMVARFVAYIEANTVRERLDSVVPGEWDSHLRALPTVDRLTKDGTVIGGIFAFKCRLTVLGISREDVGQGADYKSAATDAFKRAATRFGIGHELYDYEQNWVQVDGDGKFARPVEDPNDVYERRQARKNGAGERSGAEKSVSGAAVTRGAQAPVAPPAEKRAAAPQRSPTPPAGMGAIPGIVIPTECPKCQGALWDNRAKKASGQFSANAPDFRCKDKSCDQPVWLDGKKRNAKQPAATGPEDFDDTQALSDDDSLPF